MSVWMVRGGRSGEFEETMLEQASAVIGWSRMPDLSRHSSRQELEELARRCYPEATQGRISNHVGQLHAFVHRMAKDDLVVMPRKTRPQIAAGRVTGAYLYRPDLERSPHTRPVKWLQTDLPRTAFRQDLLYSLGAMMAVCQIQRNNAQERIEAIVEGRGDPGSVPSVAGSATDPSEVSENQAATDIERLARDQIVRHLESHFKGHELARVVEFVLNAEGYLTLRSPAGPDGGADILAGRGPLGLDPPRLCVQVKSSPTPADVTILRALQGTMSTFKADQGLLVCWGGFNGAVEKEARMSFFSVRLWNADDLVDAILRNYEKLPEELQTEIPVKRTWALVLEE